MNEDAVLVCIFLHTITSAKYLDRESTFAVEMLFGNGHMEPKCEKAKEKVVKGKEKETETHTKKLKTERTKTTTTTSTITTSTHTTTASTGVRFSVEKAQCNNR